jgi:uncharacterized protein (TIGR02453 family)
MTFLRGLAKNNRKEWFEEHRGDYETTIKWPMAALIEEVDVRLAEIAPEIVGGKKSMFRIHRDVRFAKDKSPYKTNAACWFYHRDTGSSAVGDAAHGGAGFYFHMAPTGSYCGGGIWMPPRPALQRIRQSLVDDVDGFDEIVLARGFKRRFGALDPHARALPDPVRDQADRRRADDDQTELAGQHQGEEGAGDREVGRGLVGGGEPHAAPRTRSTVG